MDRKTIMKKKNIQRKILLFLICITTLFMSVGYASINSVSFDIKGTAQANKQEGIFITDYKYISDVNADLENSKIESIYQSNLKSNITLSETDPNSSITYEITIHNSTEQAQVFEKVEYIIGDNTYNNENISYSLIDLDTNTVVNSNESISFKITFHYKSTELNNNILNSLLNFRFSPKIYEYTYTGKTENIILNHSGIYKVELWGASGGEANSTISGKGAYTIGTIELSNNEELYITIGGAGVMSSNSATITKGGYNGGGGAYYSAGTGGGATDIRINGTSLNDRIMVAAGGGGAGIFSELETGGSGGTLNGINGGNYTANDTVGQFGGYGASQISGGLKGNYWTGVAREDCFLGTDGKFGIGGNGGYEIKYTNGAGAGGGGYYGGGGGSERNGGGAGGSSFISGHQGCIAITSQTDSTPLTNTTNAMIDVSYSYHYSNKIFYNTQMISGDDLIPTYDGISTMKGNNGNGHAKITLLQST